MSFNYIICHYCEIGLKGKNRHYFENRLITNIKDTLKKDVPYSFKYVKRISGRFIIELTDEGVKKQSTITKSLKNVLGLAHFSYALASSQDIDALAETSLDLIKDEKFQTFRIEAKRSGKSYPLTTQQINEQVGAAVVQVLKKKVKLKKPELTCYIEIVEKYAFIYLKKIKCLGGLPVGTSGQAISLLSGGIDSPVSSFYALKRGLSLIYLHFYSSPFTTEASIDKVRKTITVLNKFQVKSKLYLVPFTDIQKEILIKTPDKFRVILYRRFMMKIAEIIALQERASALITGEAIGQVASQTVVNLRAIEEAVDLPVIRPLIGFDKEEIIEKSKKLGLFKISILPHQDCCARFLPKFPATKANLEEVKAVEKILNIKKLINKAIKDSKIEIIN